MKNIDPRTGSHPGVRFESHPAVEGPLYRFSDRAFCESVIEAVVHRTSADFEKSDPRLVLEETLYLEKLRLKKSRASWLFSPYIAARNRRDRRFNQRLRVELKDTVGMEDCRVLLEKMIRHFATEICGRFDPKMYRFATRAVPWIFNWLLNALSVRRIIPFGLDESLQTRLRVVGEVDHLQQLSKNGTVLLVPTHLSNIDSILIGYVIHLMGLSPFAYGAGLNLFTNPVLAFAMSRLGAYTVDRQKTSLLYKNTLKNYSTEILKRDTHSIFFPGGGRSRTGAVESHLKLGLLGTAIQAQIERLKEKHPTPNIYVVPMTMSYHFTLEAASLIEDYLEQSGKHRFVPNDSQETVPFASTLKFFWKLFSSRSELWLQIGKPLDVFGNFVDREGASLGPNGTQIHPKEWLITEGTLKADLQRDREYTQKLGDRIADRFHAENLVLSSHVVAFTLFQVLRKQYPHLDVFKFLRLSEKQRAIPIERFREEAKKLHEALTLAEAQGRILLSDPLRCSDMDLWIEDGVSQLGLFHGIKVVKMKDGVVSSEDMNLLYYYRNRLSGYGLGTIDDQSTGTPQIYGEKDGKGFLV